LPGKIAFDFDESTRQRGFDCFISCGYRRPEKEFMNTDFWNEWQFQIPDRK